VRPSLPFILIPVLDIHLLPPAGFVYQRLVNNAPFEILQRAPGRARLLLSRFSAKPYICTVCVQVLRLGNVVPDFSAQTTQGDMPSWHEWIDGSWAILFSHPADFTVRCGLPVMASNHRHLDADRRTMSNSDWFTSDTTPHQHRRVMRGCQPHSKRLPAALKMAACASSA